MSGPAPAIERPVCFCGLDMSETRVVGFFYCTNCDVLTPEQAMGGLRHKTEHDVTYEGYWAGFYEMHAVIPNEKYWGTPFIEDYYEEES